MAPLPNDHKLEGSSEFSAVSDNAVKADTKRPSIFGRGAEARLRRRRCLTCRTCSVCCACSWAMAVVALFLVGLAIAIPVVLRDRPWIADDPAFLLEGANATLPFVSVEHLVEQMAAGDVTLIDARPPPTTFTTTPGLGRSIPGAVRAEWQEFIDPDTGNLMEPDAIAAIFRTKGVFNDREVVVYGGWSEEHYWGEEGRIFWQLYYLNHTDAHILYGGIWAWDDDIHTGSATASSDGDFTARPVASRIVLLPDLLDTLENDPDSIFLVDARDIPEFEGTSPFGAEYGGHLPNAINYHWRDVFEPDGSGQLRDREEVRAEMLALGFEDGLRVVAYCTRGVRSSFMTAVLIWAGFDVGNYAGSWLDWSENVPQGQFAT